MPTRRYHCLWFQPLVNFFYYPLFFSLSHLLSSLSSVSSGFIQISWNYSTNTGLLSLVYSSVDCKEEELRTLTQDFPLDSVSLWLCCSLFQIEMGCFTLRVIMNKKEDNTHLSKCNLFLIRAIALYFHLPKIGSLSCYTKWVPWAP